MDGLKVGDSFTLTAETPLMSEIEPADPLEALSRALKLGAGVVIKVEEIKEKVATPWYRVECSTGHSGWINKNALLRQFIALSQVTE